MDHLQRTRLHRCHSRTRRRFDCERPRSRECLSSSCNPSDGVQLCAYVALMTAQTLSVRGGGLNRGLRCHYVHRWMSSDLMGSHVSEKKKRKKSSVFLKVGKSCVIKLPWRLQNSMTMIFFFYRILRESQCMPL